MKKKIQGLDQIDGTKRLQVRNHHHQISMHQISSLVMLVVLLLLGIAVFDAVVLVHHVEAQSACGVLFVCPTPTPNSTPISNPTPTPQPVSTPISNPTPAPTANPIPTPSQQPSPTVASLPAGTLTATASASPTAKVAPIKQSPVPTKSGPQKKATGVSISATHNEQNKDTGGQTADQTGESGFLHMLMIIGGIFLCLLLILIIGLLILRRMLLPPIKVNVSKVGVSSWTREMPGITSSTWEASNMQERQAAENTIPTRRTAGSNTDTILSGFAPSSQIFLPSSATTVTTSPKTKTVPEHPAYSNSADSSPWWTTISDEPFTT